jgi:hypothetical protein
MVVAVQLISTSDMIFPDSALRSRRCGLLVMIYIFRRRDPAKDCNDITPFVRPSRCDYVHDIGQKIIL